MSMDKITKARPLDNFRIDIVTSSNIQGIFDVKPYLHGSAFEELKDPAYFKQVKPAHYGIRWPNEQDFSSDTIICDMRS
jgi:hypothetical protein